MATRTYIPSKREGRQGRAIVQFIAPDGRRRTVSFGRQSRRDADGIRAHVANLESAARSNSAPPRHTAEWLTGIAPKLYDKLAGHGLCQTRSAGAVPPALELDAFLRGYIDGRTDLKPGTRTKLGQVRKSLVACFGRHRDIATINRGDALDWYRKVLAKHSKATASAFVKKARQFFADAQDRELITVNPFRKIKAGSQANSDLQRFVPAADIEAVIARCPDAEWKLIFALARYGGLRTPSETYELKWSDVDWQAGRIIVRSPKTEHHEGGDRRVIPLFPELLPYLRDAYEAAPEGAVHVITRHRITNLGTTAKKIIRRAGLTPWPRTFNNLRSSRETELTALVPLHVACAWIGNSARIARTHYLQVTGEHFTAVGAAEGAAEVAVNDRQSPEHRNAETLRDKGDAGNRWPPRGQNLPPVSPEITRIPRKALRNALQRLEVASPYLAADAYARLVRQGVTP